MRIFITPMMACLLMVPFCTVAIDLYSPILPNLLHPFAMSLAQAGFTQTLFIIGFTIGQPLTGSCSDLFGRKVVLLAMLSLFTAISLLPVYYHSMSFLYIIRFLQGIASASIIIIIRADVTDIYEGDTQTKHLANIPISWSIGIIVILLGAQWMYQHLGWQANFIVMSIYAGLSVLLVTFCVDATPTTHIKPTWKQIQNQYQAQLRSPGFLSCSIMCMLAIVYYFVFYTFSPFFISHTMGYPQDVMTPYVITATLGYMCGAICYRYLLYHMDVYKLTNILVKTLIVSSIIFIGLSYTHLLTLIIFTGISSLFMLLSSILFVANSTQAMRDSPGAYGTTSGLIGLIAYAGGSIASAIISQVAPLAQNFSQLCLFFACLSALLYGLSRPQTSPAS